MKTASLTAKMVVYMFKIEFKRYPVISHYNVLISSFLLENTTVINTVNTFMFHKANCGILRNFRLDRTSRSCWWPATNSTIFPRWWQTALLWHGPTPSAPSVAAPLDMDGCGLSSFKQPPSWPLKNTQSFSKQGPGKPFEWRLRYRTQYLSLLCVSHH